MAGHKTWSIGEEVIQTEFASYVADQIVAVFATAAARTAGWPTPPTGAVSALLDHLGALYYYDGAAWQQVGAGVEVGYLNQGADIGITGPVGRNIGVNANVIAGRIYHVHFYTQVNYVAAATVNIHIRQGAPPGTADGGAASILQRLTFDGAAGTFKSAYIAGRYVATTTGPWNFSIWSGTSATATMVQGSGAKTELRVVDAGSS